MLVDALIYPSPDELFAMGSLGPLGGGPYGERASRADWCVDARVVFIALMDSVAVLGADAVEPLFTHLIAQVHAATVSHIPIAAYRAFSA